jgi:ribulose-phosphate 3-epimerase
LRGLKSKKMGRVIPTVFVKTKKDFDSRFEKLVGISKKIQIDFMDEKFVKVEGISLRDIPNLKKFKGWKFEAHLMVRNPEKWISGLKKKGFRKVIFHREAVGDVAKVIKIVKRSGMKVMLAINSKTGLGKIRDFLDDVDGVLLMGIEAGREGQKFDAKVYGKIRKLRKLKPKILIQVDGGVNDKTISKIVTAGVDYVNSGSYVSGAEESKTALKKLESSFKSKL